jgi:hypothetical protein
MLIIIFNFVKSVLIFSLVKFSENVTVRKEGRGWCFLRLSWLRPGLDIKGGKL